METLLVWVRVVVFDLVVAFVLPKFLNDLDLTRKFLFVGDRDGGTLCALDAFPSGCISGHAWPLGYFG